MTDIITIIAYKENSVESYRGCVVDREDSALEMFVTDKPEAALEFVAQLKTNSLDGYGSYEFTFFINGRHVWINGSSVNEDVVDEHPDYDLTQIQENLVAKIMADADARTVKLVQDRADAKAKKDRADAEARERQRKQTDIARLKELRAQYPDA